MEKTKFKTTQILEMIDSVKESLPKVSIGSFDDNRYFEIHYRGILLGIILRDDDGDWSYKFITKLSFKKHNRNHWYGFSAIPKRPEDYKKPTDRETADFIDAYAVSVEKKRLKYRDSLISGKTRAHNFLLDSDSGNLDKKFVDFIKSLCDYIDHELDPNPKSGWNFMKRLFFFHERLLSKLSDWECVMRADTSSYPLELGGSDPYPVLLENGKSALIWKVDEEKDGRHDVLYVHSYNVTDIEKGTHNMHQYFVVYRFDGRTDRVETIPASLISTVKQHDHY